MLIGQAGCLVEHELGCDNAKSAAKSESVKGNVQILQVVGSAFSDTKQLLQKLPMYQFNFCPYFGIDCPNFTRIAQYDVKQLAYGSRTREM